MATHVQMIGETARQIRRCLAAGDEHEALRWVAQFVAAFERASPADRPALVADEPPSTGDRRWDAMLAGVAEQLCFNHELAVPAWSLRPDRFLDQWWFVTPYRSLHASAFASTPAALAARVERDADDLQALFELGGFGSVDEALDQVQLLYPHQPIPPRAQYLLHELFPGAGDEA